MFRRSAASTAMLASVGEIEQYTSWILGMAIAVNVFFQAHVKLPGGLINVNLADPLALLALTATTLHLWFAKQYPAWRIDRFNLALAMMSVMWLLAFLNGWTAIGVTQWALAGRLVGWLVLLGYLSAGYLIVTNIGPHGLRRFAETVVSVAVVIVIMQVILRLLEQWEVHTGVHRTPNFEGYAGNRNAFAFQLLTTVSLLLGYFGIYARGEKLNQHFLRRWFPEILLGILWVALIWTGSRMGVIAGLAMLLIEWFLRPSSRRSLYWSVATAALLWFFAWTASQESLITSVLTGQFSSIRFEKNPMQMVSPETSNQERLATLIHGFDLWLQSPLFGAGLGVFNAKSSSWFGHPQVIHSTPFWILTECGLLGLIVVGWSLFLLARYATQRQSQPSQRILLLLLSAFFIFGLAHEILFQRIFWLVLGAVLAQPFSSRVSA